MESEIEIVEGRGHAKYGIPTDSPFAPSNFVSQVDLARHVEENQGKEDHYHLYDGGREVGVKIWAKKTLGKNGKTYWSDAVRHVEKPVFPTKERIIQGYLENKSMSGPEIWRSACEWMKQELGL